MQSCVAGSVFRRHTEQTHAACVCSAYGCGYQLAVAHMHECNRSDAVRLFCKGAPAGSMELRRMHSAPGFWSRAPHVFVIAMRCL